MEVYSVTRQVEILPFAITWMEPEDLMLSETGQAKSNTNDLIKEQKKPTCGHREQAGGCRGAWEQGKWGRQSRTHSKML